MKFPHVAELNQFIKEEHIFPDFKNAEEIFTGGNSYNFKINTTNDTYFLKIFQSQNTFNKIKTLYLLYDMLYHTQTENFAGYKFLVMPYYDGHKLRYTDCTTFQFWKNFFASYNTLPSCQLPANFIEPMQNMLQLCAELEKIFSQSSGILNRFIYRHIWQRIKQDLIYLPTNNDLIHGDLTTNNILISADNKLHILDWEQLRYGYIVEDLCGLALELAGFRGLFGHTSRLKNIIKQMTQHIALPKSQWIYGMQIFYINLLKRRLANDEKQSLRKQFCLLLIVYGYFRALKTLENVSIS
ncbi:MAG: aminoglycoside phosphotransferase family protein [Alphaproteobacteria bacterium]|nr:aminoglycoside phosphotransferase family protein [Alphaproteobacteria bacterium]